MYTRRDQVDAYSFVTGRLAAAVLRSDPDGPDRPLRRTGIGLIVGIMISLLVIAITVALHLFTGTGLGRNAWQKPGSLIVAEDSGSRYLFLDGVLRPVLNLASARLIIGKSPAVVTVKSAELGNVPRGAPIGILGAPDALPAGSADSPWTVCAGNAQSGFKLSVTVGAPATATELTGHQGLLVTSDGQLYLAWQGTRLRVVAPWVPRALGLDPGQAVAVDSSWLNALPSGPDIGAPPFVRDGTKAGPVINGSPTAAGQLVVVPEAVGANSFVAQEGGLVPVTPTVAALLNADPGWTRRDALRIAPSELATQNVLPAPVWQTALPSQPPNAPDLTDRVPCVRWNGTMAQLVIAPPPRGTAQSTPAAGMVRDGRVADRAEVLPGAGFLARTRPAPNVPGAGIYLITESGAKFPVASPDAATALGFSADSARLVPAELLALLPTGPVLDKINSTTKEQENTGVPTLSVR